jgi:hypothetical protein
VHEYSNERSNIKKTLGKPQVWRGDLWSLTSRAKRELNVRMTEFDRGWLKSAQNGSKWRKAVGFGEPDSRRREKTGPDDSRFAEDGSGWLGAEGAEDAVGQ